MAAAEHQATLDRCLNEATDPANQQDRWDCIQTFYQLVSKQTDGPQVAIRLLVHKIQSPQEREALQALTVLEACMSNCGKRFHVEAAKFRFLNELIKVLSPKYLGQWTPERVKERVTEILYGWTVWLKEEPKIQEAYLMLKKQGLVLEDPELPVTIEMAPPPQRSTESVFDQEEKAKLLAKLLKSARPEDLETANRLIKSTIQEEQEKAEKESKRLSTLQEVASSTKQLRGFLKQRTLTGSSLQPSDDMKAAFERCERLRPSLFRLASDATTDDSALAQILAANDELTLVVNTYKDRVGRAECNGRAGRSKGGDEAEGTNTAPTSPKEIKSYHLIDLSALDAPQTGADSCLPPPSSHSLSSSILSPQTAHLGGTFHPLTDKEFAEEESENRVSNTNQPPEMPKSYYAELMQLDVQEEVRTSVQCGGSGPMLRARGCGGGSTTSNGSEPSLFSSKPAEATKSPAQTLENACPPQSLTNIFVPIEKIRSSHLEPITLYDQGGVHVSLHFAKDVPAGHPSVAVAVVSTVNTSGLFVRDLLFQAAVPKTMAVKLQPASGTHLHPYNPLLPPPAVSQVLLLANPQRQKVRLRYKLTLVLGEQQISDIGEVDNFPDWVSLVGF